MIRLIIIVLLLPICTFAQNDKMQIGNAANSPDAILQIDANDRGVLVPRMNSIERVAIVSPADGLLVYDIDKNGFWFYNGIEWLEVYSVNSDGVKYIKATQNNYTVQAEQPNIDDDIIKFKIFSDAVEFGAGQVKINFATNFSVEKEATPNHGFLYRSTLGVNGPLYHSLRVGEYSSDYGGLNSVAIGLQGSVLAKNGLAFGGSGVSGEEGTMFGSGSVAGKNGLAMGASNNADGLNSTVWGSGSSALENASVAWGGNSKASAINATAWGLNSQANGLITTAFGAGNAIGTGSTAWGAGETPYDYSFAWGVNTETFSNGEIALGHDNEPYTPTGDSNDKIFALGGGTNINGSPNYNVFQVLKDNSAVFKNKLKLVLDGLGVATLALKEETNGSLFGFEFEYVSLSEKLYLRSKGFSGNDAIRMTLDQDDRVGLGLSPTTNRLEVNGNASKSVTGPWAGNSDSRLKKNIEEMNSQAMLDKVLQMQGVSYEWNDDKTNYDRPEVIHHGFIAQDLEKIWPEKVSEDNLGYLQTAYGDFDPFFVGAFRQLQKEIESLENENEKIRTAQVKWENENDALMKEMVDLEKLVLAAKEKLNE